ncbi:MAG: uracil phosphoribosyltransferase [Zavarzinella sp.]
MSVNVSQHPLIKHKLALLRDANTEPIIFRTLVQEIAQLLFFEAAVDLQTTRVTVQTPVAPALSEVIWERVGIIPILRAGLGMSEGIVHILPKASVWHLGLYRDHTTLQPVTYYKKLPDQPNIDIGFVVDPMLATGGSASHALTILKTWGLKRLKLISIIAAPEGITALQNDHPDVPIHLAALDDCLNEHAYIVPGLGDAGDRQFGT